MHLRAADENKYETVLQEGNNSGKYFYFAVSETYILATINWYECVRYMLRG